MSSSRGNDKYDSFRELEKAAVEARDYSIAYSYGHSGVVVMAPHGGEIEPGTTEVARAVAGKEHGFYSFTGLRRKDNAELLHLTSSHFDEPRAVKMAEGADTVLALHGCQGREAVVYVGGKDRKLKEKVARALEQAGFGVRPDPRLPGRHPLNICNRSRRAMGVQLEITAGLRRSFFKSGKLEQREMPTQTFDKIVVALRRALSDSKPANSDGPGKNG